MKLLYLLFRQDPNSREGVVIVTSLLGVIVNLLIAAIKIAIGLAVSSISVVSEGVNNATDSGGAILALVGVKLAGRKPTAKHPFGFGRIEYLTSLIISILIMLSGYELIKESIKLIFEPVKLQVSMITLTIVAITAGIKLLLGVYTIKMGKKVNSSTLIALGLDGRDDSFVSVITIVSSLVFIVFDFSVDAYAGIVISLIIMKTGFEVLSGTVRDLLGRSGEKELADKLYSEIRKTKYIVNVADMMLHNYGPDRYSGSANVEIDHSKTIGEVYQILHDLQLRIMHEYNVTMVFGIYAVDSDRETSREMRKNIAKFILAHEHVKSFHALYFDNSVQRVYCDLVVDYDEKDWSVLHKEFEEYMKNLYPQYSLELVIETEYV